MSKRIMALVVLGLGSGCASPKSNDAPQARQQQRGSQLQVVPLQFAVAADLAAELGKLQKGVRTVADARTNSLVLMADSKEELAQALEIVARLDVEAPRGH